MYTMYADVIRKRYPDSADFVWKTNHRMEFGQRRKEE